MKACRIITAMGVAGLMLLSVRAEAARPRSHECVVVVESIDLPTRTLHAAATAAMQSR